MRRSVSVCARIVFWVIIGILLVSGKSSSEGYMLAGALAGALVGVLFSIVAVKARVVQEPKRGFRNVKVIFYTLLFALVSFFIYMSLAVGIFTDWPADELLGVFAFVALLALVASLIGLALYMVYVRKKDV